jgi:uncharacterized protein YbjT (DUF2867 family)
MPASLPRNLVTGGAGFVGSHLVDRLIEAGDELIRHGPFHWIKRSLSASRPLPPQLLAELQLEQGLAPTITWFQELLPQTHPCP